MSDDLLHSQGVEAGLLGPWPLISCPPGDCQHIAGCRDRQQFMCGGIRWSDDSFSAAAPWRRQTRLRREDDGNGRPVLVSDMCARLSSSTAEADGRGPRMCGESRVDVVEDLGHVLQARAGLHELPQAGELLLPQPRPLEAASLTEAQEPLARWQGGVAEACLQLDLKPASSVASVSRLRGQSCSTVA